MLRKWIILATAILASPTYALRSKAVSKVALPRAASRAACKAGLPKVVCKAALPRAASRMVCRVAREAAQGDRKVRALCPLATQDNRLTY